MGNQRDSPLRCGPAARQNSSRHIHLRWLQRAGRAGHAVDLMAGQAARYHDRTNGGLTMLTITAAALMMFVWPGHDINQLQPQPYASMAECERALSVFHGRSKRLVRDKA